MRDKLEVYINNYKCWFEYKYILSYERGEIFAN